MHLGGLFGFQIHVLVPYNTVQPTQVRSGKALVFMIHMNKSQTLYTLTQIVLGVVMKLYIAMYTL